MTMHVRVHPSSLPANRQLEVEFIFGTMTANWVEGSESLRAFHGELGQALDESDEAARKAAAAEV